MLRSETPFPTKFDNIICSFMKRIWEEGWLDEYSNDHFLIMALENRLKQFSWNEQFLNNNNNSYYSAITKNGMIDYEAFSENFCTNLSVRLSKMASIFGEEKTEKFIKDQLSAGKQNYNENAFFQAFSEIEILTFFHRGFKWQDIKYEPPIDSNGANPEACFIGKIRNNYVGTPIKVKASIEVKTPEFPRITTHKDKVIVPAVLLTDKGRGELSKKCTENEVEFILPRVTKLVDFINSAAKKFDYPNENEYNLLYINWAYCDFPSNAFLEAWSLLTNEYNGLLTHPEIATTLPFKNPVSEEAYKKITAIIVYTSSIDQLMFCNFTHVWQRHACGCKFRMFVLDEKIRNDELSAKSNLLFQLTGMNPDPPQTLSALFTCSSRTVTEKETNCNFFNFINDLIIKNTLTKN